MSLWKGKFAPTAQPCDFTGALLRAAAPEQSRALGRAAVNTGSCHMSIARSLFAKSDVALLRWGQEVRYRGLCRAALPLPNSAGKNPPGQPQHVCKDCFWEVGTWCLTFHSKLSKWVLLQTAFRSFARAALPCLSVLCFPQGQASARAAASCSTSAAAQRAVPSEQATYPGTGRGRTPWLSSQPTRANAPSCARLSPPRCCHRVPLPPTHRSARSPAQPVLGGSSALRYQVLNRNFKWGEKATTASCTTAALLCNPK